ncbi:MAG TPA: hypothetical protein VFH78_09970 [Candidatus Thermoplasmatota archaeon]|nr:hypothetical protein [Candidatus Thermoplasmatota archaeon]
MRRAPLVLLALVLLLPLAQATTVSLPRWQVGDSWTYEVVGVEGDRVFATAERHVRVVAREPFTYQGASYDGVTIATWQNASDGTGFHYEDVRDAESGALLATRSDGQTLMPVEPCVELVYPIEVGGRWSGVCDMGAGEQETTYMVAGGERLTVPAGSFDTLAVDVLGSHSARIWLSDAACGKVAEFSQVNEARTYVNLTSFTCASASSPAATPTAGSSVTPGGGGPTAGTPTPSPGQLPATTLTPAGATPTPSATPSPEVPFAGAGALVAALAAAALVLRRKDS